VTRDPVHASIGVVIRNACIHVANEQPLLADLYDLPSADDAGLLCTNVRSMDGKRPVFIDQTSSTFFFPYHIVRFIEIPEATMATARLRRRTKPADAADTEDAGDVFEAELAPETQPESFLPVAVNGENGMAEVEIDLDDLEIDEGLLQRIRDL
jgi:hypothetical protein